jgi:hypothetical protein
MKSWTISLRRRGWPKREPRLTVEGRRLRLPSTVRAAKNQGVDGAGDGRASKAIHETPLRTGLRSEETGEISGRHASPDPGLNQ